PRNNYTNIVLLRELESHAVFTTNGQDADVATVAISHDEEKLEYSPGLMFMRKQTGSDRRYGKSMQRDILGIEDTMNVNKMNQSSPESVLYGSAASESDQAISVTSRVMYDTTYTVRDSTAVIDEKFQNAPSDEYAKGATTGVREPDFFEPGTLFPSVVTLRDATPEEVVFALGITLQNKRYGATTSRLGRVKNHVVDVYVGSEEGPANLELSKSLVRRFAETEGSLEDVVHSNSLDPDVASEFISEEYSKLSENLNVERISDGEVESLKESATDEIDEVLETQKEKAEAFIDSVLDS
ncbi:MAG: type I-D CRISPR-associated protein Cas7/Csc2, partial [Halobacteria archaeon]